MTGNYRCVQENEMQAIKDAVHSDLHISKEIYNWVCNVCQSIGAGEADLVPFEKYAKAAEGLLKPSSAARALLAGAPNIERTDMLVQTIAGIQGMHLDTVDDTVAMVDRWISTNREKAAATE